MKKLFFLAILICGSTPLLAQANIILTMSPKPVPHVADWAVRRDITNLVVSPAAVGTYPVRVKINTTIQTTDGTTVAVTDMQKALVHTLLPGTTTLFTGADIISFEAMQFQGSYLTRIKRTGMLPSGNYQLVVRLDSAELPVAVSNTQTKFFFLSATQLPVLIAPAANAGLPAETAQSAISFRWTPVCPRPSEPVHYRVQVFEVLTSQSPMQALRSNQPLLNQEVTGTTQYIWRPGLSFADAKEHRFVWTIQTYDYNGQLITGETGNGEGRSEVGVFTVISKAPGERPRN